MKTDDVDQIVQILEARGLGWSLDHTANLIEARIWKWPSVIGRYRPIEVEPLAKMLARAMLDIELKDYPIKDKEAK